ncbi:MAG: dTDP-4-dehydrorhamnose reductase [Candidatus Acidiferrales bacterium]
MKPKILLTGKSGQVGRELELLLPRVGEVIALDRQQLDFTNPADIRRIIRDVRPQIIVNAAAYTAVDLAEQEEATARAINAHAPAVLAEEAMKIGAALIHYSTDYVFDGSKRTPYEEADPPSPVNVYGRTKIAGEQSIRETGVPHLIFRTEWVYAKQGRNFLLTILKLATQREELRVVSDQIGTPTSAREIAQATTEILGRIFATHENHLAWPDVAGTYHMTAAGETNWCEFANAILEEASQVDPPAAWLVTAAGARPRIAKQVTPVRSDEYPAAARRPPYSVLSNSRLAQVFGVRLPDWRAQLHRFFTST